MFRLNVEPELLETSHPFRLAGEGEAQPEGLEGLNLLCLAKEEVLSSDRPGKSNPCSAAKDQGHPHSLEELNRPSSSEKEVPPRDTVVGCALHSE